VTRSEAWDQLRLTRSQPPGFAAEDPGGSLYRAAMQQLEDLMAAAEVTGSAARPLPLFYALSQAGQALEACSGIEPTSGHGIGLSRAQADVLHRQIEPWKKRPGRFQSVSECVLSQPLLEKVELGALLASLPEVARHIPLGSPWPRAIEIVLDKDVEIGPSLSHPCDIMVHKEVRTVGEVKALLRSYPEADNQWTPTGYTDNASARCVPLGENLWAVPLRWNIAMQPLSPALDFNEQLWIRPSLGGEPPPNRLMTWWLVTFALSMLARYHPVAWVAALDVNRSPIAVLLERAMSEATNSIPELLLEEVATVPTSVDEEMNALEP